MKKYIFLSLNLLLITIVGFAQTKKITLTIPTSINKTQTFKVYDDGVLGNSDNVAESGAYQGKIKKSYLGKDESGTYQLTHTYILPEDKQLSIVIIYKLTVEDLTKRVIDDDGGMMSIEKEPMQLYINEAHPKGRRNNRNEYAYMFFKDQTTQRQYLRGIRGLPSKDARIFAVTLKTGEKKMLEVVGKLIDIVVTDKIGTQTGVSNDSYCYFHKDNDIYTNTNVETTATNLKFIKRSYAKLDIIEITRNPGMPKFVILKTRKPIKCYIYQYDRTEKEESVDDAIAFAFPSKEEADAFEKELDIKAPKEEKKKKK